MEDWAEIRRLHRAEGMPIKAIARQLGLARNTVRAAIASDVPPRYERAPAGSIVEPFVPGIEALLREFPTMPASVIGQRIGWEHSASVLRAKVAQLRPRYAPPDPVDRVRWGAGEVVQCDLWFPPAVVPDEHGVARSFPVLSMICAHSRFLMAVMIPSRAGGDILEGMYVLLERLGAVPKMLLWDNEAGLGAHRRLAPATTAFAGTLGTRIWQARPYDPETKGMVERANGYQRTSFLPGRRFTSPADFNAQLQDWLDEVANRRKVRALGARPIEVLETDRAAMGALPPVAPATGLSSTTRLGRDYHLRLAGVDYSIHPEAIGRIVSVRADHHTVTAITAGREVACHARLWAGTVTDPVHVAAAAAARAAYQQRPARAVGPGEFTVPTRDLVSLGDKGSIFTRR